MSDIMFVVCMVYLLVSVVVGTLFLYLPKETTNKYIVVGLIFYTIGLVVGSITFCAWFLEYGIKDMSSFVIVFLLAMSLLGMATFMDLFLKSRGDK